MMKPKLWIGEEEKVYVTLSMAHEVDSVGEAKKEDGNFGFLLRNGEYFPVVCESGEWMSAGGEVAEEFYKGQIAEWGDLGMNMPMAHHNIFLLMVAKAGSSMPEKS